MEKLVKLLNEYEEEKAKYWNQYCNWQYIWWRPICTTSYDMNRIVQFSDLLIISKMYEFIKWLVDNDKIDFRKVIEKEIEIWFKLMRIKDYPKKIKEEDIEELLMILAIQDNPIEFLVSILK